MAIDGQISLREDENPKIIVSNVRELTADGEKTAAASAAGELSGAKILYLRVPSLSDSACAAVRELLSRFRGTLPVSIFDASTKTYHKQQDGILPSDRLLSELKDVLGAANVVPK